MTHDLPQGRPRRVRVFVVGVALGFAAVGVAFPMARFLLLAWSHAGF